MNLQKQEFQFLFILLLISCGIGRFHPGSENVCLKTVTYQQPLTEIEKVPVTVQQNVWCWDVSRGFKCHKKFTNWESKLVHKMVTRTKIVPSCCDGYEEEEEEGYLGGTVCRPKCRSQCHHGICIRPNLCDCTAGYYGEQCNKVCRPNKWGKNCQKICLCLNGGTCDIVTGHCICAPGWQGDRCQQPCSDGYYGQSCYELCNCYSEKCNHITGECFTTTTEVTTTEENSRRTAHLTTTVKNFQQQTVTNFPEVDTVTQPVNNNTETSYTEENFLRKATGPEMEIKFDSPFSTVAPEETTISVVHELMKETSHEETTSTAETVPNETTTGMTVAEETIVGVIEVFTSAIPAEEKTVVFEEVTTSTTEFDTTTIDTTEHEEVTISAIMSPEKTTSVIITTPKTTMSPHGTSARDELSGVNTSKEKNERRKDFTDGFYTTDVTTTKLPDKVIHEEKINQVVRNELETVENTKNDSYTVPPSLENGDKIKSPNGLLAETENTSENHKVTETEYTKTIRKGETEAEGSGSDSKGNLSTQNKYSTMTHFIPSLTVVSGVSILLFLLAARWLIIKRRRYIEKVEIEKQNKLCYLEERRISQLNSVFMVNNFSENSVYLSEEEINKEAPILTTFKPVDSNVNSSVGKDSIKMTTFETK